MIVTILHMSRRPFKQRETVYLSLCTGLNCPSIDANLESPLTLNGPQALNPAPRESSVKVDTALRRGTENVAVARTTIASLSTVRYEPSAHAIGTSSVSDVDRLACVVHSHVAEFKAVMAVVEIGAGSTSVNMSNLVVCNANREWEGLVTDH